MHIHDNTTEFKVPNFTPEKGMGRQATASHPPIRDNEHGRLSDLFRFKQLLSDSTQISTAVYLQRLFKLYFIL